jgi:hypothetical protein
VTAVKETWDARKVTVADAEIRALAPSAKTKLVARKDVDVSKLAKKERDCVFFARDFLCIN